MDKVRRCISLRFDHGRRFPFSAINQPAKTGKIFVTG
jgi:hypothetical protein